MIARRQSPLARLRRHVSRHGAPLLDWLRRHVGRRGATLLFIFAIDASFAASFFHPAPRDQQSQGLQFLADVAPLPVWGVLWGGVGLLCLTQAFRNNDKAGFGAAVLLKALWALLYLGGAIAGELDRGYLGFALWATMAAWMWIVSTWPEPAWPLHPPAVVPRPPDETR